MRCKTCNYALWNLPGRTCPECGSAFKPSDFEFVPSAVKFCCRQCMQPYYGTTWHGHLMPIAFTCVSCGSPVHMDDTIVLPTDGVDEERTIQGTNPWLDRRRGFLGRFFGGIGGAMVKPGEMARGTPPGASAGSAIGFALLVNTAVYTVCWGPQLLLMMIGGGVQGILPGLMFIGFFVVAAMIGMLLWAVLAHVLLKVTGRTLGGFRETCMALGYSAGANTLSAVPCMGFMFGWIWWVVSAALMLREFQRVGGGRAALAAVAPPVVVVGLVIVGYMWWISNLMTTIARSAAARPMPTWSVQSGGSGTLPASGVATGVLGGVRAWSEANQGRFPDHPADLVAYRYVNAGDWFVAGTGSTDLSATIGRQPLRVLDMTTEDRIGAFRRAAATEARDAVRPASGWRRLGDVLLADMGAMTLDEAIGGGLWVVAACPDPDLRHGPGANGGITIVAADGVVIEIPDDQVVEALVRQNTVRAAFGLPALSDPRGVRHWDVDQGDTEGSSAAGGDSGGDSGADGGEAPDLEPQPGVEASPGG